jgi:hypothetical protein
MALTPQLATCFVGGIMEINAPPGYFDHRDLREVERSLRRWRRYGIAMTAVAIAMAVVLTIR